MRIHIIAFLLAVILVSCAKQNQFPEKISNKIPIDELQLETDFANVNIGELPINKEILELLNSVNNYNNKNVNFNFSELESKWESVSVKNNSTEWNTVDSASWIESTGFLLELTGKAKYAEMLESISNNTLQQYIAPYILTKRLDHIYVNLFQAVEINYPHTLGGDVSFRQKTDYPRSGKVNLYFGMTERRHIELFIRIPSWAEGTTVTVKQVKYCASPGSYCKIVKKWKEGDLVEIQFPMEKFQNSKYK